MKIAVVYNRESKKVINLFGMPNREKYGLKSINRIVNALKKGGHQVKALEGDKDLIDNLENFMPRVLKGELPGLVFNLSYGIQGQARYTHVPSILEMVGIPYVGSGPLAHSLALDKVVAKMIFRQNGLPTPDFAVLDSPGFEMPELEFPLIVKPKNEAVSFGIKIVNSEEELRKAAGAIFDKFQQAVLAERYIEGREINVGILGNSPPAAFIPAELTFTEGGPKIYTYEDKTRRSGREIGVICPAPLDEEMTSKAQEIAIKAFNSLGCYDCARIDMRLDDNGDFYILEINSLPSLGEHGSYVAAADYMGMDFAALINKLVDVASARYFGAPSLPAAAGKKNVAGKIFSYLTAHRDALESRLEKWSNFSARTSDMVGRQILVKELDRRFREILMVPNQELTDNKVVWTWETAAGSENGTLLICQTDVPFEQNMYVQGVRRDPEWIYGEGVGSVWGPLTIMEFALRSLRNIRKLRTLPLAVLCYSDEGLDCRYSSELIKKAMARADRIIVLKPANPGGRVTITRRGQRKYFLFVEGKPIRLGRAGKGRDLMEWLTGKLSELQHLTSRKERIALAAVDVKTEAFPMLLPHRATVTLLTSFPSKKAGDALEEQIKRLLGKSRLKWELELVSNRPPFRARRRKNEFVQELSSLAETWELPFAPESSVWPSVAGLARQGTPVICGMGPGVRDLSTGREAVERISLIQRTLLLSQYLATQLPKK